MQSSIAILFWIALGLTLYVAVGYPYLLCFLVRLRRRFQVRDAARLHDEAELPAVSVILPAWHDDKQILDRLQNLLEADYPADRLEIVVGTDVRDDLTGDLAATVNDSRVRLVQPTTAARGPAELINACLATARHDIVVLTDCGVRFERQTIRRLAGHFCSPHVGAVMGRLLAANAGSQEGPAGLQEWTVEYEAAFGVAPASGGTVAAYQRELLGGLPAGASNAGLFTGLMAYASGLDLVYQGEAVARRRWGAAPAKGGWCGLFVQPLARLRAGWALLRAAGCSRATLVLASHWLRRQAPVFVVTAMMGNAILAGDPFYLRLLLLHEGAYLALLIYLCLERAEHHPSADAPMEEAKA
jgi:hypothetical protein